MLVMMLYKEELMNKNIDIFKVIMLILIVGGMA